MRSATLVVSTCLLAFGPSVAAEPGLDRRTPQAPSAVPAPAVESVPLPTGPTPVVFPPHIREERIVAFGRRPRPDGAVQASVEDEDLARWNVGGSSNPSHPSNRPGFHVAPRVKVDVEVRGARLPARSRGSNGTLSELAVLSQARNHGYWPFRLCYEAGLRLDPRLRGRTAIRLTLARSGHVASSRLLTSDLGAREVASCLVAKSRKLSFAPGPPRRVDVDLSVDLNPGDAPLPSATPSIEAPSGRTPPADDFDEAAVDRALAEAGATVAACYSSAQATDPALWGRLAFRVDFDDEGWVTHAEQSESRFPASPVVTCGERALREARLPRPRGPTRSLLWAIRLGDPRPSQPAEAPLPGPESHSPVAESAPPRVPVGR